MINFFVERSHEYTIHYYRKHDPLVRIVPYDRLFKLGRLPAGCCVFADLERLSPAQTRLAGRVWKSLQAAYGRSRLLNHPLLGMRRYELLRDLRERGVNDFDAYRLTERRFPKRFPVFVRSDTEHGSICSGLLRDQRELDEELERMLERGEAREDKLVVEFQDARGKDGLYRVYGAYVIRDKVVPSHVLISRRWDAREYDAEFDAAWARDEELRYLDDNPHEARLVEICRGARIEYGRVDYGLVDGRIQVWEINTNPRILDPDESPPRTTKVLALCERFRAAFNRIPGAAEDRGTMAFVPALSAADRLKGLARPVLDRLPYDIRYHMRGSRKRPS